MRRTVLFACLLVFCASPLAAQGGRIGLYSDINASDCAVNETVGEVYNVYVFHVNALGATGSQFSVPIPPCSQAIYGGESPAFSLANGDSQNGVAILYGTCRSGTFRLMRISYYAASLADPCCEFAVLPDPREPSDILGADCNFELYTMSGSPVIINPNATCDCAVPVDDTSWGRIKSLYR